MKCPTCTTVDLLMTERLNIEIDYCPQCRGVWLDRGELDKIIERSVREAAPAVAPAVTQPVQRPMQQPYDAQPYGYRDNHHDSHHGGYRQKKSIWKELFD
ncbi:zf-TFIIB domain-containing protein [Rhodoferax sp.]|uniref:TFIIB-type zinc ribbon-containing protein n=1 Tax=Rhodoferax sp. TaxID=50421 RepID=UPI0028511CBB|nr:zf-TFIIB domain-containing protein [Rhodoferax sp.]MDR3371917.1 zf-TFIIB domain-containing protein [Rhodoferax sp.]